MKTTIFKRINYLGFLILGISIFGLTACGGGGSSDSDGGSSFVGAYNGSANATFSGPGGSFPIEGGFGLVVKSDGGIEYYEANELLGTGKITGNQAQWSILGSLLNGDGIKCTGVINYTGTASGLTMTGAIASNKLVCDGVNISIGGTWKALKSNAKANASSLTGSIRKAILRK